MKNETVNNQELVKAMQEMNKSSNAYTQNIFIRHLIQAKLYAPVEHERTVLEKEGPTDRIRFESIRNDRGERFYMGFTDMDEYGKWNDDGKNSNAILMRLKDFGTVLLGYPNDANGFVIDPYGENISISKKQLASILNQMHEHEKSGMK